jgi:sarcosine oxidase
MAKTSGADIIVVGLGAIGSAITYQLAKRGAKVIGIDSFEPPHDLGSSHGGARVTRQAVGEGDEYVPLVLRSHEIWDELENKTGHSLLQRVGALIMASQGAGGHCHGQGDFVGNTIRVAKKFGIAHEVLDAKQVAERFPQFRARGEVLAYFEPGGGLLRPEACVGAQLQLARELGATICAGETVHEFRKRGSDVLVTTNRGQHTAKQVIAAAGPWQADLLGPPFLGLLKVYRQVQYWFEMSLEQLWQPDRCPVFIWLHSTGRQNCVYGFPMLSAADGVKVATEEYEEATDPARVDRRVSEFEVRSMFDNHVAERLIGLGPSCRRAVTCFHTLTPDSGFLVCRHPEIDRMLVISACSGHAFKHSAAFGESIAELVVDERTTIDLSGFSLDRFLGHGEPERSPMETLASAAE